MLIVNPVNRRFWIRTRLQVPVYAAPMASEKRLFVEPRICLSMLTSVSAPLRSRYKQRTVAVHRPGYATGCRIGTVHTRISISTLLPQQNVPGFGTAGLEPANNPSVMWLFFQLNYAPSLCLMAWICVIILPFVYLHSIHFHQTDSRLCRIRTGIPYHHVSQEVP